MEVYFPNTAFIGGQRYRQGLQDFGGDISELPDDAVVNGTRVGDLSERKLAAAKKKADKAEAERAKLPPIHVFTQGQQQVDDAAYRQKLIDELRPEIEDEVRSDDKLLDDLRDQVRKDPELREELKTELRADTAFRDELKAELSKDEAFRTEVRATLSGQTVAEVNKAKADTAKPDASQTTQSSTELDPFAPKGKPKA